MRSRRQASHLSSAWLSRKFSNGWQHTSRAGESIDRLALDRAVSHGEQNGNREQFKAVTQFRVLSHLLGPCYEQTITIFLPGESSWDYYFESGFLAHEPEWVQE